MCITCLNWNISIQAVVSWIKPSKEKLIVNHSFFIQSTQVQNETVSFRKSKYNFVSDRKIDKTLKLLLANICRVKNCIPKQNSWRFLWQLINSNIFEFLLFYSEMSFISENLWKILAKPWKFYFLTQNTVHRCQSSLSTWILLK